MLANVLRSTVAVRASIQVVRAFVNLRQVVATHKDLVERLAAIEKKYDQRFKSGIRHSPATHGTSGGTPKPPIGFLPPKPRKKINP
jgi:hypothetical protein